MGGFVCPACSGVNWRIKTKIHSCLDPVPAGLTRPVDVKVSICQCESCGLEFNQELLEKRDLSHLYTDDQLYSTAEYAYENELIPKYTVDTVALIENYQSPPGKLLEIGFLDTAMLERFSKRGWHVEGVDLDNCAVQKAHDLGYTVFCADVRDHKLDSREYDVVVAIGVLEHIEKPTEFLGRINSLLVRQGLLLLQLPNPQSLNARVSRFSKHGWDMYCEPGHVFHYRRADLLRLLRASGFEVVDYTTSTIRIRGKIPVLPVRIATLEHQIASLIHKSRLFLQLYTLALSSLDILRLGDTHVVVAKKRR